MFSREIHCVPILKLESWKKRLTESQLLIAQAGWIRTEDN